MPLPELRRFRVIQNRSETERTFTLVLEPADGKPIFTFKAGQWVMLHLLNDDGSTWAKAAFSMATAPYESTTSIELGIKIYGNYTKRAKELKMGDEVALQGPYGVFVLPDGQEPLVLLAAGIGVTPLRSMYRESLHRDPSRPVHLFYTDKSAEEMAYADEIRQLAREYENFKPVLTLTREIPSGWEGEQGRMDAAMVQRYVRDAAGCMYAMCGPDAFMDAFKSGLAEAGVDVKTRLKKELFG